jgi:L-aminopeptidase/D-esterase-like protein
MRSLNKKEYELVRLPGIRIGHAQDERARTGCSVILCPEGAVAGYDIRGAAPGTRETDLLRPGFLVERVHGVLLTGGSAFGLAAAGGVVRYLEDHGAGYDARGIRVPIVPASVIFDLHVGEAAVRPDEAMGYAACEAASESKVLCGQVGAGTGATVGKILGMDHCMDGGFGYAAEVLDSGLVICALMVVNALGDVVDPETGNIIAGAKNPDGSGFVDTLAFMRDGKSPQVLAGENTTIGAVITNAVLTKAEATRIAQMAQTGIARSIRPAHTQYDGDLIFALSVGEMRADVSLVGSLAARCVERAILRAVQIANGLDKEKIAETDRD